MPDGTPRQPPLGSDGPIHVPRISDRFAEWLVERGIARRISPPIIDNTRDELDRMVDTDKPDLSFLFKNKQ